MSDSTFYPNPLFQEGSPTIYERFEIRPVHVGFQVRGIQSSGVPFLLAEVFSAIGGRDWLRRLGLEIEEEEIPVIEPISRTIEGPDRGDDGDFDMPMSPSFPTPPTPPGSPGIYR
jgi:hypothetical protein